MHGMKMKTFLSTIFFLNYTSSKNKELGINFIKNCNNTF